MIRIQITLPEDEARALAVLTAHELRDPREQVRLIVRDALEKRGLLVPRDSVGDCQAEARHD